MSEALILVAEDERDIRDLIVFTLQIADFKVVEVPNGEEAVKKALEVKPDLILMDVRMPKMTGFEACKALKQQEKTKDIPVIFLSAKGQEAEISTGLDLGAEEYFLKPFAPDELINRVNKILRKYGKL
ncbi:MAG: two-component system response regulator [Anaerolineae bacterium]|nr:response regulator [Anaerolineales bacterium]MCQ3974017.1 two-component system response regulator [Anaerolineae bacterium]